MPQAGSAGIEIYYQAGNPLTFGPVRARPGDIWNDGKTIRQLSSTNDWITLGGPALDLTV